MTVYYIRSTDGSNADTGATWALAKLDISGFASADAAGDTAYVSQVHAESTNGNLTWAFAGTVSNPTKLICGNDGAEPPTALATTATANTTGASRTITVTGSCYAYGLATVAGDSGTGGVISLGGATTWQQWESCSFQINSTGAGGVVRVGGTTAGASNLQIWRNVTLKFGNTVQGITIGSGFWHWNGGGFAAGTTAPTTLITSNAGTFNVAGFRGLIENCDFSAGGSTMNLYGNQTLYNDHFTFRNLLLPSSWTGSFTGTFSSHSMGRAEIYNCNDAASHVNYKMKVIDGCGNIDHETTFVKAGGASDGTTPISWKLASNAETIYPVGQLVTHEILYWNEQVGVAKTFALDFLHDSATGLNDDEFGIDVRYFGSSSSPICSLASSRVGLLTAASALASSSAGWTTTGMSNPNKQKASVTFTPQAKGFILIKAWLAKPSKTIYVDPVPVVS